MSSATQRKKKQEQSPEIATAFYEIIIPKDRPVFYRLYIYRGTLLQLQTDVTSWIHFIDIIRDYNVTSYEYKGHIDLRYTV